MAGWGDPSDVENYITQAAVARGIDPNVALTVYRHEGPATGGYQSAVVKNGDREQSFGPFQLYSRGLGANAPFNITDPTTWKQNVDYGLDKAKAGGWGPWYGAKAAGITGMMGIGPSNWQVTSNAGAKGDLAPQQASTGAPMADNTAQDNSNIDIGPLLKNYLAQNTGWGALGPSLMALGGGIAAGGAPGGGGWGAGLGMGLQNANEIQQQRMHNTLSIAELANALKQQEFERGIQTQQLGLSQGEATAGRANILTRLKAGEATWKSAVDTLTNPDNFGTFNAASEAVRAGFGGAGKVSDAQNTLASTLAGALGHPLTDTERKELLPTWGDTQDTRASKVKLASQLIQSAYSPNLQSSTPDVRKNYNPDVYSYTGKAPEEAPKDNKGGSQQASMTGGKVMPKVGEVRKGYKFKGGNPADSKNWEAVQ